MSFRVPAIILLLLLLLITSSIIANDKIKEAQQVIIGSSPAQILTAKLNRPMLITADTCYAKMHTELAWRIDGWVWGYELYEAYIDPEVSCQDPYPFTILAVNMPMVFDAATPLDVQVDIIEPNSTAYPGCHVPGDELAVSSEYNLSVPEGGGLFDIWIPLDTPIVVNGPFFAGFYIGNKIDTAVHAAVVTDDDPPDSCDCFNVWDSEIGWVDLNKNDYYNFPGRLVLYAAGIPGGDTSASTPDPAVHIMSPDQGDTLFARVELWAVDTSGSDIIDYVTFAYTEGGVGGPYYELGRDYDGASTLRDGVNPAITENGYTFTWDFSSMTEGQYTIRMASYDTRTGYSMDYRTIYLEPTPPVPQITSPEDGDNFCSTLDLVMVSNDEDLSVVEIARKNASFNYSVGLTTLQQNSLGDVDGDAADGNFAFNDEFGDYYSGPAAATVAAMVWYDRGYTSVLTENSTTISIDTLAEHLAALFKTRENLGTFDDLFYSGLQTYFLNNGDEFDFDFMNDPNYFDIRRWLEDEERSVMLGLGGVPGLWMAVDGFQDWRQEDSTYQVRVSNPESGTLVNYSIRNQSGYSELYFNGRWHQVDLMVSMLARDWTVSRTMFGFDLNGADGWSYSWTPTGVYEDSLYFIHATTKDASNIRGYSTSLFQYNCTEDYVAGDYDDNGEIDIADLTYLINFIINEGPAPIGGAGRADSNCDNYINVSDIVYFMNYIFGSSDEPCR